MGFMDKVVAPLAGHAAKHTSPGVGHKAVDAVGADKVAKAMSDYLGPEASVKMLDEAGPEHLADVLGPEHMAELLKDTLALGDPKNRQMLLSIGPQRMAAMMKQLGKGGAVEAVLKMGPANTAACTITVPGPRLGADMFLACGDTFAAGLLTGMGPLFVANLMRAAGPAGSGGLLRGMGPQFAGSVFKMAGADFLGDIFLSLGPSLAGPMLAAAGVDFDAALFQQMGPDFVAQLMFKTGAQFMADMLKALGVDNSTKVFELAGAPFVAALLKALGPDFNALLVTDLGKGAVLLGIDLGAGFLAEVASHSDASFLLATAAVTTGELVSNAADAIADSLNLKGVTTAVPTGIGPSGTATCPAGSAATAVPAGVAVHTGTTAIPAGTAVHPVPAGGLKTYVPTSTTAGPTDDYHHTHHTHHKHPHLEKLLHGSSDHHNSTAAVYGSTDHPAGSYSSGTTAGSYSTHQVKPGVGYQPPHLGGGAMGQAGGAAVPAAAVAAAPAGWTGEGGTGDGELQVSQKVKNMIAHSGMQQPVRVTVRPLTGQGGLNNAV